MLGEYFQGTLPQLIERAKLLKAKIPRKLPRDYGALIKTCEMELGEVIARLRALQERRLEGLRVGSWGLPLLGAHDNPVPGFENPSCAPFRAACFSRDFFFLRLPSAPCIAVKRSAKFGGVLPQPFLCLADGTRMMWREFRVSVGNHRQHFGNCFRLAITAR